MTYIANLQIKVDSTEIESATKKLHEFRNATSDLGDAENALRGPRKADEQYASRLIGQIEQQARGLARLEQQQQQLNVAYLEGKISQETLAKYNHLIEENIRLESTRGAAQREALAEQQRTDKLRYDLVLKRFADEQKLIEDNAKAVIDAAHRAFSEQQSIDAIRYNNLLRRQHEEQQAIEQAAKAAATAQVRAQEELLAEQQRIDKILLDNTLRRFHEEEQAVQKAAKDKVDAEQRAFAELQAMDKIRYDNLLRRQHEELQEVERTAKAKVDAERKAQNDALSEQQRIDKIRLDSTLRRYDEERRQIEQNAKDEERARQKAEQLYRNLIATVDPYITELKRIDDMEKVLLANQGKMTGEQFSRYQGKIEALRKEADKYKHTLDNTTMSAKQLRMAQQQLPAQFTDIIVSLQGGQNPLTVFLQQGGQIRDVFGSAKQALIGIGNALKQIITPTTLALGATVGMIAAWQSGVTELHELNSALISHGNVAGMTAAQIRELTNAKSTELGSTRENTEAIEQLIRSGKLLPETYGGIAKAASAMSVASGESLDKIVEDFVSLGKEPVQAAIRLNEKYDFLTASVLEQAKALVAQGKQLEASKVLTDALAETMSVRSKEMIEHASGLAQAWHAVTKAISDTWTAASRASNPDKLMRLAVVMEKLSGFEGDGILQRLGKNTESYDYKRLAKERDELITSIRAEDDAAAASRKNQLENRFATEAQTDAMKAQLTAYTAVERAQKALELQQVKIASAGKALTKEQGAALLKPYETLFQKAKDAAAAAAAAKTPKSAILDSTDVNDFQNKISEIKAQYKTLNETIIQQQNAGTISSETAVAKRKALLDDETAKVKSAYQQQIAALEELKGSKNISQNQTINLDKQIADARSKMVVALEEAEKKQAKLAGDEKARLKKQQANVDAYSKSLQQMLDNLKVAGERERAGLSQSSGQRDLNGKLNSEDDRYADQVLDLKNQAAENPLLADEVEQKLKLAEDAHTKYKKQIVSNYDAMKVAQRDWVAGASSAYEQYVEDGQNAAGMANEVFTNAFSGMEDALVDFVTTGKLSFADLTKSILADMARIAIRAAASQALTAMFGGFGGAPTSAGSTQAGYNNLAGWKANAKGSAYNGGTQFFAKGGAFTNSVVSKPTAFSSNSSPNNVMGEAGPEAIMPLTRANDGSLGVRAQVDVSGLQQGAGSGVQVYITIDGEGNKQTSANDPGYSSFGNEIGQFVDQRYKQLIGKDLQPGGDIWKSMQG